jgi:hypothetical protein
MASKKEPLSITHPELAAQADGWDPTTVAAGAAKIVAWKCALGHTWNDSVSHRSTRGSGCPYCANKRVLGGFNDLVTTFPELAAQADGWDPTTLTAGSAKAVDWRCASGHTWKATVASRSARGGNCPVCSNKLVLPGVNDLATTHPELAAQADGWDPTTLTAGSHKKVGWKCALGHTWKALVKERSQGTGCPVCSNKKVMAGHNDLATTHPELAAQADGWDPTTVVKFSHKNVNWLCASGHTWKATVASRSSGRGCPICSGRQVLFGLNDLATTHPELAAQADGWDPTTLSAGSDEKVGWKCALGHTWKAAISSRSGNQRACPVCSNKLVLPGFNDLATTHPELAAQADGWDPTTLTAGSHKKVGWKCALGHTWNAVVGSRSIGLGCPVCAGKLVLLGFNDLATTHPELAAQADGWDPTTLTAGSSTKKVQWRCEQNHLWKALVRDRSRGIGCPSCSSGGFDPNQSGWLYLIDHDALNMFQIGISNVPKRRLGEHSSRGWEVMEVRGPMEGHLAQDLETAILHALERRGAVLGHKAQIEKFDGYSEAWTKDSLKVSNLKQLLDWVYEDEN